MKRETDKKYLSLLILEDIYKKNIKLYNHKMIIKTDQDTICHYFEDSSGMLGAHADKVVIAESKQDVIDLFLENKSHTPVTIAAGCTGVTGGCLAYGGIVLSTERLNSIGSIKEISDDKALITVGGGAVVNDIKKYVLDNGWMYAPDPTEKNATIGGNISTNASGGRGFKYGTTRNYINALEIVFPDGSFSYIERGRTFADNNGNIELKTDKGVKNISLPKYKLPDIKNAAGYFNYEKADLIDIFIGQEGTLGVIVSAELILIKPFEMLFGGIIFFDKKEKSWDFVKEIRDISNQSKINNDININALSLEYFDRNALNLIKKDYPVIPANVDAGILFEQDCTKETYDLLMEKWIKKIEQYDINTDDVWFASNIKEQEEFRIFRHKIPERVNEIVKKNKIPKVGTDVAVPHDKMKEMIYFCEQKFSEKKLFNLTFGHIGESHLHANLIASTKEEYEKCREIYLEIAKKAVSLGGTVSAEHGIGKVKHIFLEAMLGVEGIEELRKFKKSMDVYNILGQNNMFKNGN
jgi:D-lactate dehydrogenase (cytochrome)